MKFFLVILLFTSVCVSSVFSRDIRDEMRRARELGKAAPTFLLRNEVSTYWSPDGSHLAWRVDTGKAEIRYGRLQLDTGEKSAAFDHDQLASALASASSKSVDASQLPLEHLAIMADGTVGFRAFGKAWIYHKEQDQVILDPQPLQESELLAPEEAKTRGDDGVGAPSQVTIENATADEIQMFWVDDGELRPYEKIRAGGSVTQSTYVGHLWLVKRADGEPLAALEAGDAPRHARVTGRVVAPQRQVDDRAPDARPRAFIRDHNVFIEPKNGGEVFPVSDGGCAEHRFTEPLIWSPDSKMLIAFQVKTVATRQVHLVQSSPPDQLQPRLKAIDYTKPGDPIEQPMPRLFDIENRREIPIDATLFGNPWEISEISWALDSSEFRFVYNQRGHQVLRIVGVRADSGAARTIFEDVSQTFIDYSQKFFIHFLPETEEILWASERDGRNHLYLIDSGAGGIKKQITQGDWNVREVVKVDAEKRQLLIKIMGVAGQDPYHMHFARVNFDGGGFTRLTAADGTHRIDFSPCGKFLTATWSRVDHPPVVELRRVEDGSLVAELERADDDQLQKTGWKRVERFVAKGRDGQTDIHGVIFRPTHFDPKKRYPVVEDIYAGPHDFFVPKHYVAWSGAREMAELGFIVVKIDGMGTNWRDKRFHDVAWKNLADGGFPDRIAWIKAAAATRPWMDLERVGIYGGSAGGQNALAAMLHHGDFYRVGVSDCGCHDNRMDKIWWNEAWMGWPVDESYERNSNVTHAAKLTGKLLLIVGEMDSNVDPASTTQVVHALQQADKDFDFLPIINAGHGAAETPYGKRRRADFLVKHLRAE